ncbi:PH domain-containing protein [Candidatus Uhrbacteria bacterium]|nr:PH domain-containing protein [Candidatus Uhrbacteria bacterium]
MIFFGEKVILKVRKHPLVFFIDSFFCFVLLCAPLILLGIAFFFGIKIEIPRENIIGLAIVLAISLYYLYALLFLLFSFFMYFLDRWIVTEKHVVDVKQTSLFSRTVAKQEIGRIQDVTAEVKGFFQTIFDFGNVYIQTAGEQERFVFENVPDPNGIANTVMKVIDQQKQKPL